MIRYLLLFTLTLLLPGCDKDDPDPGNSDPFLGEWEIVEAEGPFADSNLGTTYTFRDNGSVSVSKGFTSQGTYARTDAEITITIGGIDVNYTYTLTDRRMDWTNTGTPEQKFVFEKK